MKKIKFSLSNRKKIVPFFLGGIFFLIAVLFLLQEKLQTKKLNETVSFAKTNIIDDTFDGELVVATEDKISPTLLENTNDNLAVSSDLKKIASKEPPIKISKELQSIEKKLEGLFEKTTFRKNHSAPNILIVIDDIGYNLKRAKNFLKIKQPITFAILPNLPQSSKAATILSQHNKSILMHMPMEPKKNIKLEKITLLRNDNSSDVYRKLEQSLATVPYLVGVSNHMGSFFTENAKGIDILMQYLQKENLFFLDSKTTNSNLSEKIADKYRVTYYERDIFLDNSRNHLAIAKQLLASAKIAFRQGTSIAIGHPYKETYQVLAVLMPKLESKGIQFQDFSSYQKQAKK
jgi:polysaccharide deacetylase 2 family uncharacterized protein YibQ